MLSDSEKLDRLLILFTNFTQRKHHVREKYFDSPFKQFLDTRHEANRNTVIEFINQFIDFNPQSMLATQDLYTKLISYSNSQNLIPLTQHKFGRILRELGFRLYRTSQRRYYKGIAFKS